MNNVTKINVDVQLVGSEAEFFNNILKDKAPKELVEMIFRTGFAYLQGTFVGAMIHDKFSSMQIPMSDKPIEKIQVDKVFYDGEPTNFSVDENGETLRFCNNNLKDKDPKVHSIYVLKNNKPLQWGKVKNG